ncbi:hypothetical protein AB0F20_25430, partial [Streptomyces goshikiensis]|uniref:hypothetical protein n=1 Tax=Streptomyces goshikiensis TaxID=1942 RepID=UPI00340F57B6
MTYVNKKAKNRTYIQSRGKLETWAEPRVKAERLSGVGGRRRVVWMVAGSAGRLEVGLQEV